MKPEDFSLRCTTLWSFRERGDWATHSGRYRGNWSPYVPRNLILRYSKEREWVLDQFVGSGTTLVEAKLLNRNAIGIDVNEKALQISKSNLNFQIDSNSKIFTKLGNATNLSFIKSESIDLICTHPPYANIIRYSKNVEEDLSLLCYKDFLVRLNKVAEEAFRILKAGKYCSFMIGDIRRKGVYYPLGMEALRVFRDKEFELKEIIIKEQHNCRSTEKWRDKNNNFLLIAHEYIFVFKKPL
ncbi:RsmD family RNA methyltransferase [Lachnospiraceae bacterium OttesenSCG-928-J05]|nr:RsmD family RNA methyltransferase [Lachnospiraceae bacterium OttesenSCG-928-J05]